MAVISIVVGAGFYTIARSTKDRALEKGVDTLHAMIRIARTQAIMNGVHARFIINADASDPESYLRRIGVVIEGETNNTLIAKDRGAILPEGVFVVPSGGFDEVPNGLPRSIYWNTNKGEGDGSAVYSFEYPLADPVPITSEGDAKWICIQFAPNGRLASSLWQGSGLVPRSNQLVVSKGQFNDGKVKFLSPIEFLGIAFKLSGSSYTSNESGLFELEKTAVEVGDET